VELLWGVALGSGCCSGELLWGGNVALGICSGDEIFSGEFALESARKKVKV